MRLASLDIGTVTCRLCIADADAEGLHELYHETNIVNLGQGVDEHGALAQDAIERACSCVAGYMDVLERYADVPGGIKLSAIATSACRDAANSSDLVGRLAKMGVELSIVPGEREAQLSFKGASADWPGEKLIVSDIGGGSTELIAGIGCGEVMFAHSFNVGCRRAAERLVHTDPPAKEELDAVLSWAKDEYQMFFDTLREMEFTPERLVAVAGTATSTVAVDKQLAVYDPAKVHAQVVDGPTLARVREKLAAIPLHEREQVTGLRPERAPIIVPGLMLLQAVLDLSGLGGFTISELDILQGILMDAAGL